MLGPPFPSKGPLMSTTVHAKNRNTDAEIIYSSLTHNSWGYQELRPIENVAPSYTLYMYERKVTLEASIRALC